MKEKNIILYRDYIKLSNNSFYISLINRFISDLDSILKIPGQLSEEQFQQLLNEHLLEDIIRKSEELHHYLVEKGILPEHFKTVYLTLSSWLRRDHHCFKFDRENLERTKKKNRKKNKRIYKKFYDEANEMHSKVSSKEDKTFYLDYRKLLYKIADDLDNVLAVNGIIDIEKYKDLYDSYSADSISTGFEKLNNYEFIVLSDLDLVENYKDKILDGSIPKKSKIDHDKKMEKIKAMLERNNKLHDW